ncbi:probable nucleoredoxin 1-2 isoform X1 [Daucus carota subsp. sativus]|uniref:probable nucleoredoxin 1-2 isoform X1 n=1 Tax=Daucus carota subsp. sativus TaxID=79200 RepID=UPI0030828D6B
MLPMSPGHKKSMILDTTRLRDVHEQIKSSGGNFSVICVPTHIEHNKNDFEYFNPYHEHLKIKFCTSFHHIHLDDSACLKQMENMIGIPKDPEAAYVILGPMNGSCRKVVSILNSDFFKWHGADAFPFTTEKIEQLTCEDEALWSCKHDLGTLLSVPDRDYVISNDCTKVPVSDLHQRTVCLLFYEDTLECRNWTEKLKNLYVVRNDFEVVVVFSITFGLGHSMEFKNRRRALKFWKVFSDMPWLAIPLDDPKCRQLWRIFSKQCSEKLLIIYSRGQYFEENGFKVLVETGFKKYPFMRKEVVRTSVAAKKEKNLSSFLGRNELIRGRDLYYAGREKFTASKLLGCSVVLLFLGVSGFRGFSDLLNGLHFNHGVTAHGVESFEIVYIPVTESPPEIVPDCDWMLVSPKEHLIPVFHHFFDDEITKNPGKQFTMAMVSFGQFGHYNHRGIIYTNCSKDAYNLFLETFPFNDNDDKESFKVLYNAAINKPRKKTDD